MPKAGENLDGRRNERQRPEEALALNASLATAYSMKEDLRQFRDQPGKRFATAFLNDWIKRAEASGVKILRGMARTPAAHRNGLLACHDVPTTCGPTEGTNNKIKTMKRQAYGFRDREFFKPEVLATHETKYEIVGQVDIDSSLAGPRFRRMNLGSPIPGPVLAGRRRYRP